MRAVRVAITAILAWLVGFQTFAGDQPRAQDPQTVYTLYRTSAVAGGGAWRLHVATFDATDGANYNRDNCTTAKALFQGQPGVTVTYWCEREFFKQQ